MFVMDPIFTMETNPLSFTSVKNSVTAEATVESESAQIHATVVVYDKSANVT